MAEYPLTLDPLERAVQRLEEGLARYQQDTSDIQIRDGLIQRFEFTYEISHKMLKRHLELASPSPEIFDAMSFQDLISTGNERGLLLGEWVDWKRFRELRGKSSHTADTESEELALEVVGGIPRFLEEAWGLVERLKGSQV